MAVIDLVDPNEKAATGTDTQAQTNKTWSLPSAPKQPKFINANTNIALSNNLTTGDLLSEIPNIVTKQEAESLVYSFDKGLFGKEWSLEGYDRQNRVQRYPRSGGAIGKATVEPGYDDSSSTNNGDLMEESFGWLFDRIVDATSSIHQSIDSPVLNHRPYEVIVTEHTPSSCRSVVDTWEQFRLCPCRQKNEPCSCYIANVTLVNNAIQHTEKPEVRDLECWDVTAPAEEHMCDMIMEENGVIVKMGDSLWNWRGRIADVEDKTNSEDSSVVAGEDGSDGLADEVKKLEVKPAKKGVWVRTKKLKALNRRSITISFRGIHPSDTTETEDDAEIDPEILAKQHAIADRPLSELLTIIVTTSPIRSNPSTEMLEHTFDTFQFAGEEFAFECKKVIVCDGCRVLEEVQGNNANTDPNAPPKIRIYSNGKQNLRNGVATMDQSKNYKEFKKALSRLCEEADNADIKSPFMNTKVVELEERHGYGFALRHALRHCVDTPYVCVIQHDRNFMRTTPIKEVVKAIICDPKQQIKYVGVNMKSNLMYFDIFCGKYGKRAMDEFRTLIKRPRELRLDSGLFGQHGSSVEEMASAFRKNKSKTMQALRDGYKGSHQHLNHLEWLQSEKGQNCQSEGCCQLSLTPTLFWYDNTHIVETAHYRDFVFNPKYKMVARGGFVEDKLSPVITRNVERMGLKKGHGRFGCYLLDDHSGVYFTGHLDGGSYKTAHLHAQYHKNNQSEAK